MKDSVIDVTDLVVRYGKGAKAVDAVRGVTFSVHRGECVGFVGANGAGKSTTLKALMGFIFPHAGRLRVFGEEAGTVGSRRRTGYLPEVALYYPFMKARELLELYGGLHGVSRRDLKQRIPAMLETVGLTGRGETLLKNFSKGMQQRLGIAQSLIAEPELLVFDELCSGLDPLGRFDLRQILLDLKKAGRTVFFSSHELTEVESLCDRILIVHQGRILRNEPLDALRAPRNGYEIRFAPNGKGLPPSVQASHPRREGDHYRLNIEDEQAFGRTLAELATFRCRILEASSRLPSLEDCFLDLIRESAETS